ncbi:PA3496 family putative envelope integrity protein [Thioalkalivibrio thiocyanodenitrificans]|uniref:PA3496 family putative envelope integrity protein n=1 Tax=Thioalkalivibrio thiocyanodenitrificans TaxID=243063 RepID=UPI00037A8E07|nr:hypothetical protein [Thioalkalivibrio thiocyanodenitrificans]
MARVRDIPTMDDELDSPEWTQETNAAPRTTARRSLERLLEKRALRRQLEDTFGDDSHALSELDW